ncbi:UNVERIFIED_CONTAM: hypothetical protein HDU68_001616 [Siphonaria sp. JEL0065]|nr:hypothetical protein HDU68_001616 [Siphonaria sp. JEL0065]
MSRLVLLLIASAVMASTKNATELHSDVPFSCEVGVAYRVHILNSLPGAKNNPTYIEPGSGFDIIHPSTFFSRSAASWAWLGVGVAAGIAVIISAIHIFSHLRNFNRPLEQVHIVRILLFVPVYAIVSWFAFRYYWRAVYIFTIRDLYEGLVVYSFYALMLQFLGPTQAVQNMALTHKQKMKFPVIGYIIPTLTYNPSSNTFLKRNKLAILQFVLLRPLMVIVAWVTQATNRFCNESLSPKYGHFWVSSISLLSAVVCIYALVVLYFTIKDDIAEYRPLQKLMSIVLVVLLPKLQNAILLTLAYNNKLPQTQYWTDTNIANGIQSGLLCLELCGVALFHLKAYTTVEFKTVDNNHTKWYEALARAFNPLDIVGELLGGIVHLVQWGTSVKASKKKDPEAASASLIVEEEVLEEGELAGLGGNSVVLGVLLTASTALAEASSSVPASCEDNSPTIDPGSGFDFAHPKALFNRDNASWAWIATGIIALAATLLSGLLIFKHLRNFNRPLEQVHIVRILLFVPVYALISWLAFRYYWRAVYIFTIRDCYEAFVIYSFYALILQFLGPNHSVQNLVLQNKPIMKFPIWGSVFPKLTYNPASSTFLKRNKLAVMQYVVIRPLMTIVALATQISSRYCSESMSPAYGHFWYSLINFVSVSVCMYALVVLYFTIKDDIAIYRPLPKVKTFSIISKNLTPFPKHQFLSIKVVIFLTMAQNMVLSTLAHYDKLPETQYWTPTNIANGIQSFLVCIEMLIAAFFHMSAFSSKEFETASRVHTKWYAALVVAFNPVDIGREFMHSMSHVAHEVKGAREGRRRGSESEMPINSTFIEEEVVEEELIVVSGDMKGGYGTHA